MHFFIFPSYTFCRKESRKQTGHLLTGFFFVFPVPPCGNIGIDCAAAVG